MGPSLSYFYYFVGGLNCKSDMTEGGNYRKASCVESLGVIWTILSLPGYG